MSKNLLAFLAFVAACVFFGLALFGVPVGFSELYAGLFCAAIGLALEAAPA